MITLILLEGEMRFIIDETPTPVEIPYDSFSVHITTYQGDGDGDFITIMKPFTRGVHEENLESVVSTLERMKIRSEHGMSWRDNYEEVLGYQQWFGNCASLDELKKSLPSLASAHSDETHTKIYELAEGYCHGWPSDPITDYETPQTIDDYKIYYYSETGEKFGVIVAD